MGADSFDTLGKGRTVQDAFRDAVEDAEYMYGHGGYSGTIAEKYSYREVAPKMTFAKAMELMERLNDMSYYGQEWVRENGSDEEKAKWASFSDEEKQLFNPYVDKWGDAGYIQVTHVPEPYRSNARSGDKFYLFFGIASS